MKYSSTVARNGRLLLILFTLFAMPGIAAKRVGAVVVPDNAYANGASYGKGWVCEFGHREMLNACTKVAVPANGHLNSRGIGWLCERGFRKQNKECVEIIVPANGYLVETSTGPGWTCDRGFKMGGASCEPIAVPDNGYLTNASYGADWDCERGYRVSGVTCVAVQVPANAFLVDINYGPGWQCERGYVSSNSNSCKKLEVPANGHLTGEGNEWECNAPLRKRGQLCEQ